MLRLRLNSSKVFVGNAFVNPSATWSLEWMNQISSCLLATLSLAKWKSISTCFVLAWKTGLADKYVASRLSHHRHGAWVPDTLQWKLSSSGVFSVKSMYMDLINTGTIPRTVHIWKVKVALKIKVFMWFVHKGVILTKDNFFKRKWEGSKRCYFCDQDETIWRLFIKCPLAKLLWRTIHVTFNITPPRTISHLFDNGLTGVEPKSATHIRVGACALLWSLWNSRNDVTFNRQTITNFLQVIFRASTWIRTWSLLSRADHREHMDIGCSRWEMVARDTYNRFGWRSNNMIGV